MIAFQMVVMVVWMPVITVEIVVLMAFHTVVAVVCIAVQAVKSAV